MSEKLQTIFSCENYETELHKIVWNIVYPGSFIVYEEEKDLLICNLSDIESSLCMQLVGTTEKLGFTIVITPTITFAKTQVKSLKTKNILASYWDGSSTRTALNRIKKLLLMKRPKMKILFLTYHQILNRHVQLKLMNSKGNLLSLIVYEADCLSFQTHKYRKEFRNFGVLKKIFPATPIIAITSLSKKDITEDIKNVLQLYNPIILDNKISINKELSKVVIIKNDFKEIVDFIDQGSIQDKKSIEKVHINIIHRIQTCGQLFKLDSIAKECIDIEYDRKVENSVKVLRELKSLMYSDSEESDLCTSCNKNVEGTVKKVLRELKTLMYSDSE